MMSRFALAAVLATILVCTSIGYSQSHVVGWRGDGTGRYDDAKPLLEWSSSKNVLWRTPMDNWTNSTPVVVGDRIFTQAEPSTLICVSASNGKVLWEHMLRYEDVFTKAELAQFQKMREEAAPVKAEIDKLSAEIRALRRGANRRSPDARKKIGELRKKLQPMEDKYRSLDVLSLPETHGVNGYTSPTPVSDGKHVYVLFSTGVAACYDMDGKRIWARFIEKPNHGWGHSTSPVLADGVFIVQVLGPRGLDAKTGKELWRAPSEALWGSPVVTQIAGKNVVITPNGEAIVAATGEVLTKGMSKLEYCAPVISDGVAYFIEHGGKAVKLPQSASAGGQYKTLWTTKPKKDRYYASPIVHEGLIYAVMRYGAFSVIDAADGSIVYEKKLDAGKGEFYPSVTMAGGRLFVSIDNGTTLVLEPGREYKEVGRNKLEEFRSTPVFVGKRMYVRTRKHLYCIGPE